MNPIHGDSTVMTYSALRGPTLKCHHLAGEGGCQEMSFGETQAFRL